jgi:hypothetical protein
MTPERICIFCKHCSIEDSRGYSEMTGPWGNQGLSCAKGNFSEYDSAQADTIETYRTFILRAVTCKDYEALK